MKKFYYSFYYYDNIKFTSVYLYNVHVYMPVSMGYFCIQLKINFYNIMQFYASLSQCADLTISSLRLKTKTPLTCVTL